LRQGLTRDGTIIIVTSYLVLGLLQIPAYVRTGLALDFWDALGGVLLFGAILLPAAYMGLRLMPEKLPILTRLLKTGEANPREIAAKLAPGLAIAALAFALNISLSALFSQFWIAPTSPEYVSGFLPFDKVVTSFSAGVWEETVFRCFLVGSLLALLKRKAPAALLANLLFTLMHVVLQDPPYNVPALTIVFVIGLTYTKCYLDYGLESAMICHAAMNLFSMVLATLLWLP
jgi:hypothetical protein